MDHKCHTSIVHYKRMRLVRYDEPFFVLYSNSVLHLLGRHVRDVDSLHLAKHDSGVAIEERNTGQTLAVGEGVHNQRLLGHEHDLSGIVGLQLNSALDLLVGGVLTHAPVELDTRQAARPQRTWPIGEYPALMDP